MRTWRPEEWVNDFENNPFVVAIAPSLAFEAGADVMFDALRKATSFPEEVYDGSGKKVGIKVFIPDEENTNG